MQSDRGWSSDQQQAFPGSAVLSVSSGRLRVTADAAYQTVIQNITTVVGGTYSYSIEGVLGTSVNWDAYIEGGVLGYLVSTESATLSGTFVATSTSTTLSLRNRNEGAVAGAYTDFDNVSVKQLHKGNPGGLINAPTFSTDSP